MPNLPHPRFVAFTACMILATAVNAILLPLADAVILGFDLAALGFVAASWPLWQVDHPAKARARALRDDGGRGFLILVAASVLLAVLLALGHMISARNHLERYDFLEVSATLILAWLVANLVFAYHYAHLFYDQVQGRDAGGIAFPDIEPPVFADFVYFAFTIGMTCQTADLNITARRIRRVVVLHGVFAFFFNLGVLALGVNVMSGVL